MSSLSQTMRGTTSSQSVRRAGDTASQPVQKDSATETTDGQSAKVYDRKMTLLSSI